MNFIGIGKVYRLPVFQIHGKRYYRDERLKQYRNVNDIMDTYDMDYIDYHADTEIPDFKLIDIGGEL